MGFAQFMNYARLRRGVAVIAAFALISMLAIGPRGAVALIQQLGDSPSPATGHAEIIAQGVSALPSDSASWRVTGATAGSLDAGAPSNYALGFTVASDGGVLVNDYTTGLQNRLAIGEAAFTPSGAYQQHASLSGDNVQYLRIGLVGAGESSDGVVYESDAFSPPDGLRDIDLLRDVLGDGEVTTVNAGSAPSLVYVLTGEVVIDDGNNSTTLQAGNGSTVDGEFNIESQSSQSIVIAAIIGNDVPAPPRISGTVTLDVRACPADVTKEQLEAAAAEGSSAAFEPCVGLDDPAKAGLEIGLTPNGDDALPLKDAELTDEDGAVTWKALAFGDYSLGDITAYPDGYGDSVMSDGNLNLGDHGDFALNRDNPDVYRVIYLLQDPVADGSIEITYYVCSVSNFDEFVREDCQPFAGGINTDLAINGAESPTTLDDAEQTDAASYLWSGLSIAENEDPAGSEQGFYLLSFEENDTDPTPRVVVDGAELIEAAGGYSVKLTPEHPSAEVDYYYINVLGATQGNIYIVGIVCPNAGSEISECDTNGSAQLPSVTVLPANGEAFDQESATSSGDAYVWTDVALDDAYTIAAANIVAPEGYEIRTIVHYQTGDSSDSLDVALSEDSPVADFTVYLDPVGDDSGTPVDTDSDGLADTDEEALGTIVDNADTDADCFTDGSEVDATTDPLDAGSFPDGDCNI